MVDFLKWLFLGLCLGWISLPITWLLFSKLPSRGYYLSKPLGLLSWGFLYWVSVSLGLMKNNLASQLTVLLVLVLLNGFALYHIGWRKIWEWIKENKKSIVVTESVFLVFFAFWTVVRAANPDIIHTEKFMEMAFINGILKSETFPPMDPWLSGYGISYYYFGYVLAAMLIRASNVVASVGYNLVSSFWFGLTAIGAYGIVSDLIIFSKHKKLKETAEERPSKKVQYLALLAPIMLLIVSNWFGALDVAHSRGVAWSFDGEKPAQSEFWTDLNISELANRPRTISWVPNRGGWSWWQASRVLRDTSLSGHSIEVIDEFPQFTFLLSDIHPHMLGMPFVLLAVAQALNAIKGGWKTTPKPDVGRDGLNVLAIFYACLSLGGIAFMNTWDFPFYLALMAAALVYRKYQSDGWKFRRLVEFLGFVIAGGMISVLLYLPFYLSFASQAGGILPSLAFFTPGKNFWLMFGPFLLPILVYLIYHLIKKKAFKKLGTASLIVLAFFALLFVFSWSLGWLISHNDSSASFLLGLQGAATSQDLLVQSILQRLKSPGTAITLFVLLTLSLALVLDKKKPVELEEETGLSIEDDSKPSHLIFVLFLIILGGLLTLAPEFVYLRDQFSWRMNTIFKFYFQAWIVWSIAATYAIAILFKHEKSRKTPNMVFVALIVILGLTAFVVSLNDKLPAGSAALSFGALKADWLMLSVGVIFALWIIWQLVRKQYAATLAVLCLVAVVGGLAYPVLEIWNKTEGFEPHLGYSLDGKRVFWESYPDAMRAAEWLEKAELGVMAEAVAEQGGSYTTYNLISTFSGMPSVLGWVGHEHQWRGGGSEVGTRQQDLRELYSSKKQERINEIIDQYDIRYIVFGNYERDTYRVTDPYFASMFMPVFETETVKIYEVRQ